MRTRILAIFAVISVVLSLLLVALVFAFPFLLVGVAVWLPFRLCQKSQEAAWRMQGRRLMEDTARQARLVGQLLREAGSGALVGGLLGGLLTLPGTEAVARIFIGLCLGALAGLLVGITNHAPVISVDRCLDPES